MQINSESSEQAVADEKSIDFPRGLPGFENHRRFRLLHEADTDSPVVYWLESIDEPAVQLSLADPQSLQVNYEIALSDEESQLLQLDSADNCALLVVLYRGDDKAIRANFIAPLMINTERRIGLQKVLNTVERSVTIRAL